MNKTLILLLFISLLFITGCKKEEKTPNEFDFYYEKNQKVETMKFKKYYENNDRTIYFDNNIKEFYINQEKEITLKKYLTNTYQTTDDALKNIVEKMTMEATFDDGGTTYYKDEDKDLRILVCNRIGGNNHVYISRLNTQMEIELCEE